MVQNEILFIDRTTWKLLVLADGSYITHEKANTIIRRVDKTKQEQSERRKKKAEVFTTSWLCNDMINFLEEENQLKSMSFEEYIGLTFLEITCGEAPFLVSRYDATTGNLIDVNNRIGILDRKLRVVNENTTSEKDWFKWVYRAYQSVYGYELQGDSLLIARINLLQTFIDYLDFKWHRKPTDKELKTITNVISWNIWQMDGLTDCVPYTNIPCEIMDWKNNKTVLFRKIKKGKNHYDSND